jgi:hypothetical protein
MRSKTTPTSLWIALTIGVLLGGVLLGSDPAHAIPREALNRGLLTTVKIATLNAENKAFAGCSGTVIDAIGYVLTNWHCVGVTARGEDSSNQGKKAGDLYHPQGLVVLGPTKDPKQAPVPTYIAKLMAGTPAGDFAVLKIVSMVEAKEALPNPLPLLVMTRGDSEKMGIGDPVHLVGYPGVGGALVTVTTGIVSGFDDQNGDGTLESIKTTAEMGGGISGGLAMNDAGEQIGVPTWGVSKGADKIDRMMMINLAVPHIDEAKRIGGTQIGLPAGAAQPSTGTSTGTTPSPGTSTTPAKPAAPTPPPASGQAKPTTPSTGTRPAPATGQGVVLTGSVVDANTKRPIQGAAIGILRPGLSIDEWRALPGKEGTDAEGATDQSGTYRTAPALPRDSRPHTVVVVADGYVPRTFENALKIEPSDPDLTQVETIEMKKR